MQFYLISLTPKSRNWGRGKVGASTENRRKTLYPPLSFFLNYFAKRNVSTSFYLKKNYFFLFSPSKLGCDRIHIITHDPPVRPSVKTTFQHHLLLILFSFTYSLTLYTKTAVLLGVFWFCGSKLINKKPHSTINTSDTDHIVLCVIIEISKPIKTNIQKIW